MEGQYQYIKANYHAHTVRCHHATGTEREFVEESIRGGLKILGFSDHAPMPFSNGYVSSFRMAVDEFDDYCDTVLALRKEYEKDIDIRLGLETEYYPAVFPDFMELIRDYPIEYLLLGQHCLRNEYDGLPSGKPTEDEAILKEYVDQLIEALETGTIFYVAHPDIFWYMGPKETYRREMRRLCEKAKELTIPLEINLLGLYLKRSYPTPDFWELVGEVGNEVCIGVDAHHNDLVVIPDQEAAALQMAKDYNLNLIPDNVITGKKVLR